MKTRFILSIGLSAFVSLSVSAQTADTVSLGNNYTNEIWYSLDQGIQKDELKDDWDIAFETSPQGASILINDANSTELWVYPGDTSTWAALVDTAGLSTWQRQYNSDTSWFYGAFNQNMTGHPDYGWGTYNSVTHIVEGSKIFVLKLSDGSFQKVWILDVTLGVYSFKHAPLGGSTMSHTIDAKDFAGKNFGYFSLQTHGEKDKEPLADDWDIKFGKYTDVTINYVVTGARQNINVNAAKAYPVNDPSTYEDYQSHTLNSEMNIIGHDWKSFNMTTFEYDIADSTVYFVEARGGDIWKIVFDGFGGSADGNISFNKKKLLEVGINEPAQVNLLDLYPNPAQDYINIVYKNYTNANVFVRDINGKIVVNEVLPQNSLTHRISVSDLTTGIYFISIVSDGASSTKKLVVK